MTGWFDRLVKAATPPTSATGHGPMYRIIHINDVQPHHFLHNRVTTAKYNFITFLPKFLKEQFSKYANLFFLFISCLQASSSVHQW
jgi:phospholipid-transporting ATPase